MTEHLLAGVPERPTPRKLLDRFPEKKLLKDHLRRMGQLDEIIAEAQRRI